MTELEWHGPHTILDMVLDVSLRPPDAPGIYAITKDAPRAKPPADVLNPPTMLYVGKSERLYERFGDLAFGLLQLSVTDGWSFHGADRRILDYSAENKLNSLKLGYMWTEAKCARCAEIYLLGLVWPTTLNVQPAYNCGTHPNGDGND